MKNHSVQHYLNIYQIRQSMQERGITDPSVEIKNFTNELVKKLSTMPLEDEIVLKDSTFFDINGRVISKVPYTNKP